MGKLDGKVVIVTGGGSGIGKSISLLYSKEGANVVIVGRNEEALKETCKLNDKKLEYVVGDVTNEESIKGVLEFVTKKFGKLDILVNNAGISISKPLTELKISDYDKTFDVNVRGLVNMSINCVPLIIKSKGNILKISSISSTHCYPIGCQCILVQKLLLIIFQDAGQKSYQKME